MYGPAAQSETKLRSYPKSEERDVELVRRAASLHSSTYLEEIELLREKGYAL